MLFSMTDRKKKTTEFGSGKGMRAKMKFPCYKNDSGGHDVTKNMYEKLKKIKNVSSVRFSLCYREM